MPTIRALVIAGGGGGGRTFNGGGVRGGGGGAGGYQEDTALTITSGSHTVTIGAGGAGGAAQYVGLNGTNSSFGSLLVSDGGGGGGGGDTFENRVLGKNGGSGGGGARDYAGGTGISGQGYNGGDGGGTHGGGGGGAGALGGTTAGFDGGAGIASSITGTSVKRGGGGGGSDGGNSGDDDHGFTYGGGKGGAGAGTAGLANTGGGGGSSDNGHEGGSGVVIIRYTTSSFGTCTGGTITTTGSDTVHTFNSSGTFTVVYLPISTTQAPTEVQALTALGNGTITDAGDANATERGFVWGTTTQSTPGNVAPASTAYDDYVTETGTFSASTFTGTLDGLIAATTHYVRAYARNATGYAYGNEKQFVTITAPNAPSLTTTPATVLATTSATLNGNVVDEGVAAVTEQGFVYDTRSISLPGNVHPLYSGYRLYTSEMGTFAEGAFSDPVSDLTIATTYFARSYAKNTGGYAYGNQVTFSTIDLNNDAITSITLTNDSVVAVSLTNDQS